MSPTFLFGDVQPIGEETFLDKLQNLDETFLSLASLLNHLQISHFDRLIRESGSQKL